MANLLFKLLIWKFAKGKIRIVIGMSKLFIIQLIDCICPAFWIHILQVGAVQCNERPQNSNVLFLKGKYIAECNIEIIWTGDMLDYIKKLES